MFRRMAVAIDEGHTRELIGFYLPLGLKIVSFVEYYAEFENVSPKKIPTELFS